MLEWIARYWLEVLFGVLVALFAWCYRRLSKRIKRLSSVELGVQALLRDRIVQTYNHYNEKGYWPIYARENFDALYQQYKALGGNGAVESLAGLLKEMPPDKEETHGNS